MLRLIALLVLSCSLLSAKCLPITEAAAKIGREGCVEGKVLTVQPLNGGHFLLNFCEDATNCPFSVVTFRNDLRDVGDVRQLEGKNIEIHGQIKEYRGHAEIILKDVRQLRGESAHIPPIPKTYDVSRHGNYTAGSFYGTKQAKITKRAKSRKQTDPITEIDPAMPE
ncbi:MAG TPA: hypothetical protein VKW78_12935 [Terriglobales bacterium]|nr:hypothetical protein [Terriglobales bacterium]